MNLYKEKSKQAVIGSLLIVGILILMGFLPLCRKADLYVSDLFYQNSIVSANAASPDICVIGITAEDLEELGPLNSWNRSKYTEILEKLYDDEHAPAAVGLDVVLTGDYDGNPEDARDRELADFAAEKGNIVFANEPAISKGEVTGYKYPLMSALDEVISDGWAYEGFTISSKDNLVADGSGRQYDAINRHIPVRSNGYESFAELLAQLYGECHTDEELNLPENDSIYVKFAYTNWEKNRFTVSQILDGENDWAAICNGKIVLIGACDTGMGDNWPTSVDHSGNMSGVDILANTVNMLISPSYVYSTEVPDSLQLAVLAVILVIFLILLLLVRLRICLPLWLVVSGASIAADALLFNHGYIMHILWIPVGLTIMLAYGLVVYYMDEARQRQQIRRQFGQYVDENILKQLLKNPEICESLTGVKKQVAVMYVDICSFTTLSENRNPEEVVQILNRYFEMVTDCIFRHHGIIDKFIGDCAMAVWNIPEDQDDYLYQAVSAGLDMIEGTESLSRELGFELKVSIGIETGEAVVGNIGSHRRMDYTVIGDTVNTASRLESLKIPGMDRKNQIYISERGYRQLEGRIKAENLGKYSLKGKEQQVQIYRVIS